MNTAIKVIFGILVVILLVSIGGLALKILFSVAWFLFRLAAGALVVMFIIWVIDRLLHGSRT